MNFNATTMKRLRPIKWVLADRSIDRWKCEGFIVTVKPGLSSFRQEKRKAKKKIVSFLFLSAHQMDDTDAMVLSRNWKLLATNRFQMNSIQKQADSGKLTIEPLGHMKYAILNYLLTLFASSKLRCITDNGVSPRRPNSIQTPL